MFFYRVSGVIFKGLFQLIVMLFGGFVHHFKDEIWEHSGITKKKNQQSNDQIDYFQIV